MTEVVLTEALTPEVLERMKALNDPHVQKVLAGFKSNVEKAVQESSDILKSGVAANIGELTGQVANKLSEAGKTLIANIPGVGIGMAALETADAAALVAEKGKGVVDGIQSAMKPITAIQSQVAEVKDAVDTATASVNDATASVNDATASVNDATAKAEGAASDATAKAEGAASEATGQLSEATGQLSEATTSVNEATKSEATTSVNNATKSEATKSEATAKAEGAVSEANTSVNDAASEATAKAEATIRGGGSRKRRHIHKLSRRIERTLRRVQKKYGLRDKNDFLRRTLRVRKMK